MMIQNLDSTKPGQARVSTEVSNGSAIEEVPRQEGAGYESLPPRDSSKRTLHTDFSLA
jgi:hypothetical protein